jgi:putative hydrolase of the HAD superfamily
VKVRGVLFDLDGTLVDHEGAVDDALRLWLPTLGVAAGPGVIALWHEVQERHLVAWRERSITFAEQRRRRLRDFLPAVGVPYEEPALDVVFEGYLRAYEDSWRAFDDVAGALADLAALDLPTAVLTNGTTEQQNDKLRRTGLAGRVGPVWTVEDLGVAKPDPEAFRLACERWGLPPSQVLSVGDRHDLDVRPARSAGLAAVLIDRRAAGPDRITSLRDLGRVVAAADAYGPGGGPPAR